MDTACVTTPFGRRPMTLALLAKHRQAEKASTDINRNKWKLFRAICEARADLGVSDRSLTVLDALLSFYPSDELSASAGTIVFPSNAQLSIRARGMTAATLRRHLAALVDAGLILRKDSPNGKRYARRGRAGEINDAFGFSLAPLLSRASEIEEIASRICAERELCHSVRERISLCRRDIIKLIQAAQDAQIEGEWSELSDRFRSYLSSVPRRPCLDDLQTVLNRLTELRTRIVNILEEQDNSQNLDATESQNERHIQDSQTNSHFESETAEVLTEHRLAKEASGHSHVADNGDVKSPAIPFQPSARPHVALDTVLRACPDIGHYLPGGTVSSWRDLVSVSVILGSMLRISASAFQDACRTMGAENAAIAIACIYERGGAINSAGAYLRILSKKATLRQFTVVPMVASLLKSAERARLSSVR